MIAMTLKHCHLQMRTRITGLLYGTLCKYPMMGLHQKNNEVVALRQPRQVFAIY